MTKPFDHSFCGQLEYSVLFNGDHVNEISQPASFNGLEFQLYSEDRSLIGERTLTVQAKLADYSVLESIHQVTSPISETTIDVINPCIHPKGIESRPQKNPTDYLYSERPSVFTISKFESIPPGCEIQYTCLSVDGPDESVQCDIPGVTTWDGIYDGDQNDGKFTFQTLDLQKYKPGSYEFTIQGATGLQTIRTDTSKFTLNLVDPCPNVAVLADDTPFMDLNYAYRDEEIVIEYKVTELAHPDTVINCGSLAMEFKQLGGSANGAMNDTLFHTGLSSPTSGSMPD